MWLQLHNEPRPQWDSPGAGEKGGGGNITLVTDVESDRRDVQAITKPDKRRGILEETTAEKIEFMTNITVKASLDIWLGRPSNLKLAKWLPSGELRYWLQIIHATGISVVQCVMRLWSSVDWKWSRWVGPVQSRMLNLSHRNHHHCMFRMFGLQQLLEERRVWLSRDKALLWEERLETLLHMWHLECVFSWKAISSSLWWMWLWKCFRAQEAEEARAAWNPLIL